MRVFFFFIVFIFLGNLAQASTWELKCSGTGFHNETDTFTAVIDADRNLVNVRTSSGNYPYISLEPGQSTNLGAIDPLFFDIQLSEDLKVGEATVSTYNYFTGYLRFYFGVGLREITRNVEFSIPADNSRLYTIAVDYDDGDGLWFHKRPYSCRITEYYTEEYYL